MRTLHFFTMANFNTERMSQSCTEQTSAQSSNMQSSTSSTVSRVLFLDFLVFNFFVQLFCSVLFAFPLAFSSCAAIVSLNLSFLSSLSLQHPWVPFVRVLATVQCTLIMETLTQSDVYRPRKACALTTTHSWYYHNAACRPPPWDHLLEAKIAPPHL
mmetsp:Transcript_18548/g.27143  ORF Transcript_18548/g.27143 Transcript_18548/m.27143 type:complete len:157 (+) Transcript_18548:1324-1794(+)